MTIQLQLIRVNRLDGHHRKLWFLKTARNYETMWFIKTHGIAMASLSATYVPARCIRIWIVLGTSRANFASMALHEPDSPSISTILSRVKTLKSGLS